MSETNQAAITTTITPHLCCRNAAEAAEFYQKAFGAEILGLQQTPDGKVMHAALSIDGAEFFLVDEYPDMGALGPQARGGSSVSIYLRVADCDAVYNRAVQAGCEVKMAMDDMFWGDRYGLVEDPYGHQWEIATPKRQPSQEELDKAIGAAADCWEAGAREQAI